MREFSQRHLEESRLSMASRIDWVMRGEGGIREEEKGSKGTQGRRRSRGLVVKMAVLYRNQELGKGSL